MFKKNLLALGYRILMDGIHLLCLYIYRMKHMKEKENSGSGSESRLIMRNDKQQIILTVIQYGKKAIFRLWSTSAKKMNFKKMKEYEKDR